MNKIWYAIGILSLIYFAGILLFTGLANKFHIFWLVLGIICLTIGLIPNKMQTIAMMPTPIRVVVTFLLIACALVVVILEGCILSGFSGDGPKNENYVIVLGAQVKKTGMSKILKQRTDAAGEYLSINSDATVIVSGGKGYNEPISEAAAMEEYLMKEYQIPKSRIIREEQSTSTEENIKFSKKYLPSFDTDVVIVTSNFHAFRAKKIAQKAGLKNVYMLPTYSELPLLPSNMVREGLALFKDWVVGNI